MRTTPTDHTHLQAAESPGDVSHQQLLDEVLGVDLQVSGPVHLAFQDLLVDAEGMLIKERRVPSNSGGQRSSGLSQLPLMHAVDSRTWSRWGRVRRILHIRRGWREGVGPHVRGCYLNTGESPDQNTVTQGMS